MALPFETTIAVLGGTGKEGSGLALRWAAAGYRVIVGSRQAEKGAASAAAYNEHLPAEAPRIRGTDNATAATAADIVVLTVPYAAHLATLETVRDALQGKILIDATVPLVPPRVSTVQMPAAGSATQEAQDFLGDGVQVVAAFQNISYKQLSELGHAIDCDVLVAGNSPEAKQTTIELAQALGLEAFDAGPVQNAMVIEGLVSLLININRLNKVKDSGIRITGVPRGGRDAA